MNDTATLLSDADLAELTGYVQPEAQIRILREHHLQPIIRRDGRPRITWDAVTQSMMPPAANTTSPNFEHLRKTG